MSQTLSRIVVATDFSAASDLALERAAVLAQRHQARVHLIHAVAAAGWIDDVIGVAPPLDSNRLNASIAQVLGTQLERLPAPLRASSESHILNGPLHRSLPEWLQQHPAELLLLGARNNEDWRHFLLGSTARRLLRQCPLPLLLVRNPTVGDYQKVLLTTDFSTASERAADLGVALSSPAQYHLLHADERMQEPHLAFIGSRPDVIEDYRRQRSIAAMRKLQEMSEHWAAAGHAVLPVLRDASAAKVLNELVEDLGADLVVLGASGLGQSNREFLGSVSQYAAATLPCDVLIA